MRATERRTAVREMQDPDVGDEEEHDPDGDPDGRPLRWPLVVDGDLGVSVEIDDPRAARPQEHDPEREAHDRYGDPGPAQHGAGAVGQPRSDRSRQIGPESEGEDGAGDEQADRQHVGPVPGQLPPRRLPPPGHHPRLRRSRASRSTACVTDAFRLVVFFARDGARRRRRVLVAGITQT